MESEEANVWLERPQDVGDAQMRCLELMLDAHETARASRFRFEGDRRAYVVAHGVRRLALGEFLEVDPVSLVLEKQISGKPVLVGPGSGRVFFSHSHTRDWVAVVVSSKGPVGIDVECVAQIPPDFDLLAPHVVVPDVGQRVDELGIDPAVQFFFYWTALEAFWKAAGKGLSPENPRIHCQKNEAGAFEISLEGDVNNRLGLPRASVLQIPAPEGCMVSLAQHHLPDWCDGADRGSRSDARALSHIKGCRKKDGFLMRTRHRQPNSLVNMVSR